MLWHATFIRMSIIGCCWSHKGGDSVVIGSLLVVDLIMCLCVPFLLVFVSHLAFPSYPCLSCIVIFLMSQSIF